MPTAPEFAFENHRAQVYAWAYRLVQNHHDALDVTQEVFLKWWRAHTTSDAPKNAIGWLRRVTVNLAIDAIRSTAGRSDARNRAPHAPDPTPADPTEESTRRETALQVATALEALTDRQRAVVVAKVYDACTFARIAEQMGMSVPTVKTHYLRALRALRHTLLKVRPDGLQDPTSPDRAAPLTKRPIPGDRHEL
ncbi:MAG TPA: RNA polymerase sigma factor [Phycisphaerae bacterium]|nr:RNA polymerase sigma factor [Phycisphaerae bacterium]